MNIRSKLGTLLLLGCVTAILVACSSKVSGAAVSVTATVTFTSASPTSSPTPTATFTSTPQSTNTPSPTFTPNPSATPTLTPVATTTPTFTSTPDPYDGLTITDLATRSYGGGELQVVEILDVTNAFTRTLVTYPSDGLTLYGFMNIPPGEGAFPVALVMHGYVPPEPYNTLTYTTRYADALARAGYLVIHPNYRNWPPSDEGPDLFRVSHAVDALNLIAIIRDQAGQTGPLEQADPDFIGLMGHSMGGGITLRTITVSNDIQAAALYGSMSGDEAKNFERILYWSGGARGQEELDTPAEDLERISPIYHLDRITAPVSIHHGDNDGTVPLEWSLDLCEQLQALNQEVECFTYPGQPHTFQGESDQLFIQRVIDFFDQHSRK